MPTICQYYLLLNTHTQKKKKKRKENKLLFKAPYPLYRPFWGLATIHYDPGERWRQPRGQLLAGAGGLHHLRRGAGNGAQRSFLGKKKE